MRLIIILLCTFSLFNCAKDDNPTIPSNPSIINEPPMEVEKGLKYLQG